MSSANILVVDDDESMRIACTRTLESAGYRVQSVEDGPHALEKINRESFDVVLLDLKMPGMSGMEVMDILRREDPSLAVVMITGYGTLGAAVKAGRLGAHDFLSKPFEPEDLLSAVDKAARTKRQALEDSCVHLALDGHEFLADPMVGRSEAIHKVISLVKKVAPMDSTVLITGETGSGKELVARTLHRLSKRSNRPFVTVDCGSLVETLFESEMFGHIKGSFTGAIDTTRGKFEIANGGTLFLDEISNININLQARLLRVVQEQEIHKVGSPNIKRLDVRIIAATNRDLWEEIRENRFRKDLFYRLNVVSLHIPPLRERRDDIPLLSDYFLKKLCRESQKSVKGLSEKAMMLMESYEWPGNVRELQNAIERAMVVCEGDFLRPEDMMLGETPLNESPHFSENGSLAELEKREILRALQQTNGNRGQAAANLGINRKTLREKIRKYGIRFETDSH